MRAGIRGCTPRTWQAASALETPALAEGVYGVSCTDQSSRILINVNGWRTPGGFQLWDMQTGEVFDTFSASMAGLDADRLVRPEDVRITARDGVELQGLSVSAGRQLAAQWRPAAGGLFRPWRPDRAITSHF
jgi:dipeptidyl aminopeptidase/acylaminoacyl peptidase